MPTYKIIGADLMEYGPVSAEQIRQWINEGRAVCPIHNHVIRCDGTVQRGASGGSQP
jgi:hypothetical protein